MAAMNIKDWIDRALKEPTLTKAIALACLFESERIVEQATRNKASGYRDAEGKQWDTCFEYVIGLVIKAWSEQHPDVVQFRNLKTGVVRWENADAETVAQMKKFPQHDPNLGLEFRNLITP